MHTNVQKVLRSSPPMSTLGWFTTWEGLSSQPLLTSRVLQVTLREIDLVKGSKTSPIILPTTRGSLSLGMVDKAYTNLEEVICQYTKNIRLLKFMSFNRYLYFKLHSIFFSFCTTEGSAFFLFHFKKLLFFLLDFFDSQ